MHQFSGIFDGIFVPKCKTPNAPPPYGGHFEFLKKVKYICNTCAKNFQSLKELVARPIYISLNHFIVLIFIIHVLWYDTRQENYYFISKVIDKRTKIK